MVNGIFGYRYQADFSAKIGGQLQFSDDDSYHKKSPALALLSNGSFIVTWATEGGKDGDGLGIYARIFDSTGSAHGTTFPVNTHYEED